MPQPLVEIHGYAIVSDDDKIADENGLIPAALRNDKDWEQYQTALARSDLVVFARKSHENEPETHGRPRMVVSHDAEKLENRGGVWWWNPDEIGWAEVIAHALPGGGEVAAPGGQGVFNLFLKIGYDVFHLARAHGVRLPSGRPIFSECTEGVHAEAVLIKHGLRRTEQTILDSAKNVEMNIFRAIKGAAR